MFPQYLPHLQLLVDFLPLEKHVRFSPRCSKTSKCSSVQMRTSDFRRITLPNSSSTQLFRPPAGGSLTPIGKHPLDAQPAHHPDLPSLNLSTEQTHDAGKPRGETRRAGTTRSSTGQARVKCSRKQWGLEKQGRTTRHAHKAGLRGRQCVKRAGRWGW